MIAPANYLLLLMVVTLWLVATSVEENTQVVDVAQSGVEMTETTNRRYTTAELYDIPALKALYETSGSSYLRRLIGSNCIYIERGEVTPYYGCIGCVVEEAIACIDDMRMNKSGNVRFGCDINSMQEVHAKFRAIHNNCCPAYKDDQLNYIGLAYPEALACIRRVGCGDSVFFNDILNECERTCDFTMAKSDTSICYASMTKSAAVRSAMFSSTTVFLTVTAIIVSVVSFVLT